MADPATPTRSVVLPGDAAVDSVPKLGVLLAIFDFPLLVAGYRVVINAALDLHVVGAVDSREKMSEQVARLAADIVVTDCLPNTSAGSVPCQAIDVIRAARPTAGILAIDHRCGSEQSSLAIRAGANGFLTREATPADVLTALRCIGRGESWVSPSVVTRMVNTQLLRTAPEAIDDAFDALSDSAREVFRLAAVGHSSREIARELHVSEQTVHNHRATIMEKLGFHRRVELLKYALRRGIIGAGEL